MLLGRGEALVEASSNQAEASSNQAEAGVTATVSSSLVLTMHLCSLHKVLNLVLTADIHSLILPFSVAFGFGNLDVVDK